MDYVYEVRFNEYHSEVYFTKQAAENALDFAYSDMDHGCYQGFPDDKPRIIKRKPHGGR